MISIPSGQITTSRPSVLSEMCRSNRELVQRLETNPSLLIPPSVQECESQILPQWRIATAEAWAKLRRSADPPASLLWILGMEGANWVGLPGWLVMIPWPATGGPILRPALILSDREFPAAGQVLRLAVPWNRDVCLVSPIPPVATLKIADISTVWIGAALDFGGPFLIVDDPSEERGRP